MARWRWLASLVALGTACTGASAVELAGESAAIGGGLDDATDVAVVGVAVASSGATCTGALIAPNLVVTAQHCVASVANIGPCTQGTFGVAGPPADFFVTTRPALTSSPADYHRVAEVGIPPGGDGICGRDIAVLRLVDSIAAAEAASIAPRLDGAPAAAERYAAVGYGGTDQDGTASGTRRRRDGLAIGCVGDACASSYLAAAEWLGEAGVCVGDSGGPALDAAGLVIGVASRGAVNCTLPTYTAVSAHADWLVTAARQAAMLGGYVPPPWAGGGPPVDAGVDAAPALDAPGPGDDTDDDGGCRAAPRGAHGGLGLMILLVAGLVARPCRLARRRARA